MKIFILTCILGFAYCGNLDHLYLPASQRAFNGAFGGAASGSFGGHSGGNILAQTYTSNNLNQVPILKFAADNNGEGSYGFNYETGNGISAQEQGDARGDGTRAHGSYSYISPEGEHVSLSYNADQNGFVPQGSHIPTPPPIPEAILKSLQENAAAEARGIFNEGSYHGEGLNEGQYKPQDQGAGAFARTAGVSGGYAGNGGYKY